jgi:hypothetical protein
MKKQAAAEQTFVFLRLVTRESPAEQAESAKARILE